MATHREITKKKAADYARSSKNAKVLVLDELVAVTGWSRVYARRRFPPRALDLRLVDPALFQHGPTKISAIADLLASVYEEHKDRIFTDPSTGELEPARGALQLVFCDFGTPSERWNVYGELKDQLRRRGVPEHMVRFTHEAKNDNEKGRLFAAARSGQIAVLVGSTSKMGVGTNIQKRAVHLVDMDAPWRPADVEQRHGRILLQGNQNREVRISQVVTKESFDSFVAGTGGEVPVHQPDHAPSSGRQGNRRHRG